MKKYFFILICLILCLSLNAAGQESALQPQIEKVELRGSVVTDPGGTSVPGVTVVIGWDTIYKAKTDLSGRFAVKDMPAGTYPYRAYSKKRGYVSGLVEVTDQASLQIRVPAGKSVAGLIKDRAGKPVSGAVLTYLGWSLAEKTPAGEAEGGGWFGSRLEDIFVEGALKGAVTGSDGRFSLGGIPVKAGYIYLKFYHPEHGGLFYEGPYVEEPVIAASETVKVTIGTTEIEQKYCRVFGKVTADARGTLVYNPYIMFYNAEDESGGLGSYEVAVPDAEGFYSAHLKTGRYIVRGHSPGRVPLSIPRIILSSPRDIFPLNIFMVKPLRLRGKVINLTDDKPVAGTRVSFQTSPPVDVPGFVMDEEWRYGFSGADGWFELLVPRGQGWITLSGMPEGFKPWNYSPLDIYVGDDPTTMSYFFALEPYPEDTK